MPSPPTQVAVAVVRENGRFLVGIRSISATLPGLAEFPGGKVAPHEQPGEAAHRECFEETGLEVFVGGRIFSTHHSYPHGEVVLHFFDCRLIEDQPKPRPPFRWVDANELASLEFPEANAPLIEELCLSNKIARKERQ